MGTPVVVAGALMIFGGLLLAFVFGVRGVEVDAFKPQRRSGPRLRLSRRTVRLLVVGFMVGLVMAVVSGFVIAVVLAPVLFVLVPWLLSPAPGADRIAKLEALEEWTRSLAGVMGAGQGIDAAILASRRNAKAPIDKHVNALCMRLNRRWSADAALKIFAEEFDDPQGDMVVSLLVQGVTERGQGLPQMLADMATSISEEITSYRSIETEMKEASGTARAITLLSIGALTFIVLASGDYVSVYTSPAGQSLAAVLFVIYVALLILLRQISTMPPPPRLLGSSARAKVKAA